MWMSKWFLSRSEIEIMNDWHTVKWLRSANRTSRRQTLREKHLSALTCILKRALHYPGEWVHAQRGDVIAHATCSLGLVSVARANERWLQLMIILCTINICSPTSLQNQNRKKISKTANRSSAHLHNVKSSVHSHHGENNRVLFNNRKKGLQHFKGPFGSFYSPLSAQPPPDKKWVLLNFTSTLDKRPTAGLWSKNQWEIWDILYNHLGKHTHTHTHKRRETQPDHSG